MARVINICKNNAPDEGSAVSLTVLGTRGSLPVSGAEFTLYGTATSSYLFEAGDEAIILDAGNGILNLPDLGKRNVSLIITHTHLDHILGLPSFLGRMGGKELTIYGAVHEGLTIRQQLDELMKRPLWPIGIDDYGIKIKFVDMEEVSQEQIRDFCGDTGEKSFSADNSSDVCIREEFENDSNAGANKASDGKCFDKTYVSRSEAQFEKGATVKPNTDCECTDLYKVPPRFKIGDVTVTAMASNHPGESTVIGLEYKGKKIVYATDFEHTPDARNVKKAGSRELQSGEENIAESTGTNRSVAADGSERDASTTESAGANRNVAADGSERDASTTESAGANRSVAADGSERDASTTESAGANRSVAADASGKEAGVIEHTAANNEGASIAPLEALALFSKGADLILYDGQYFNEEYDAHMGFGHSSHDQGISLKEMSGARFIRFIHHDPGHRDDVLREIDEKMGKDFADLEQDHGRSMPGEVSDDVIALINSGKGAVAVAREGDKFIL